jgi:GNAT superfamily N-acetyltransferase
VEHFAVNPVLRNGGVGSRMLKALKEDAEKMIILEVEPPIEEIAVRRVRFYERNGFFFNDYPYIQPSMGEGRKETPLFLMSTERKIDEEEYRMIRNTLYTKVYGKKDVLERERFIDMC